MNTDAIRKERFGRAEQVLGEWSVQRDAGGEDSFANLVAQHADLAPELRELAAELSIVDHVLADGRQRVAENRAAIAKTLADLGNGKDFEERYQIEAEIGKGGMGAVYRVLDRRLGRSVAMKVILGQADASRIGKTPEVSIYALQRFLNEARITGELEHPGIVPVYELGLDAHGRAFFAMQLVNGQTLGDVLKLQAEGKSDWSLARVLQVIQRICEAMAYVHERGIVHRDLKPHNIMVGKFGGVYVMDWGIARRVGDVQEPEGKAAAAAADQALSEKVHLTRCGDVLGTPAYMPPEQAGGRIDTIDKRSDVYAVGAILYEALAGHAPYLTPGRQWKRSELLDAIKNVPPDRLSTQQGPAELIAICERAMAHDIKERYPNIGELAADLSAFVDQRAVKAYATGPWVELKKWVWRNKALTVSAISAVVMLIGGVGVTSWLAHTNAILAEENSSKVKEFDLLSSVVLYDEALKTEGSLYPAWPTRVEDMEIWLRNKASPLLAKKPDIERAVRKLEASDLPATEADKAEQGREYRRARDSQGFLHDALHKLLGDLERLNTNVKAAVEKRLAWAKQIQQLSLNHPQARHTWEKARNDIKGLKHYEGANLQLLDDDVTGLVPMGVNPATKLYEFYDLVSACGLGQDLRQVAIPSPDDGGSEAIREDMGIVWVLIPGGTAFVGAQSEDANKPNYDMGAKAKDKDDERLREVVISPFLLAKFEVTRGQMERMARHASMEEPDYFFPSDKPVMIGATHPAESVSWTEAHTMARRCGMRLPTKEEWEYACRAGQGTPWASGDDSRGLEKMANLSDQSRVSHTQIQDPVDWNDKFPWIAPVGCFKPNLWGLYDMHGNVWEWCAAGNSEDAQAPYKGGSYATGAFAARAALLGTDPKDYRSSALGVRACRSIK